MNPLFISAIFIYPPSSFTELNDRLDSCKTQENLQPLQIIKLDPNQVSDDTFSLQEVLDATRFPLQAYRDVAEEQVNRWKRSMLELFPARRLTSDEKKLFQVFSQKIPYFARPPLRNDPRTAMRYIANRGIDVLDNYTRLLGKETRARLDMAMEHPVLPQAPLEQAKKLQVILNMLLAEQELVMTSLKKLRVNQEGKVHHHISRQNQKVIPLDFFKDSVTLSEEDYPQLEESNQFAIILQIKETSIKISHEAAIAVEKKNPSQHQPLRDILKKLDSLKLIDQSDKCKNLIERTIHLAKSELLLADYNLHNKAFSEFRKKLFSSPLLGDATDQYRLADDFVVPFSSWLLSKHRVMEDVVKTMLEESELPTYGSESITGDLDEMQLFCERWYEQQHAQKQLYQMAYQDLQNLIDTHRKEKNKIDWINCNKVLFGEGALPKEMSLCVLPSIEELTPNYQAFFAAPKAPEVLNEPDPTMITVPAPKAVAKPPRKVIAEPVPTVVAEPAPDVIEEPPKAVAEPPKVIAVPAQKVIAEPAPKVIAVPPQKVIAQPAPKAVAKPPQKVIAEPAPKVIAAPAPKVIAAPAPKVIAPPAPKVVAAPALKVFVAPVPKVVAAPALDVVPLYSFPGKEPPFLFDPRVMRWHEHPVNMKLVPEIFGQEYADAAIDYQRKMIDYHSFSLLADRFYDIGIQQKRKNPATGQIDTQHFVAAEIKRTNEAAKRGIIIWAVDPESVCYHKFFHEKENRVIVKKMMEQTFSQADFPTLEKAANNHIGKAARPERVKVEDETAEIDPILGQVTISNRRLGLLLTLYRSSLYLN